MDGVRSLFARGAIANRNRPRYEIPKGKNKMANRYFNNVAFTLAPAVVKIFARVTFGAAGAPTLVQGSSFLSKGVVSVTRDSQGVFTFVFGTQAGMLDVYNKLLNVSVLFDTIAAPGVPAAPLYYLSGNAVATAASCSLQLTFTDDAGATATDPADGEAAYFEFTFKNSTAP